MPPVVRVLFLIWVLLTQLLNVGPSYAQDDKAKAGSPSPAPGVRWTKIQDLNPNAPPTNAPVKQKWAVVVGVGRYKESRLNSDVRPDQAAAEFRNYLLDPHGGRFDERHVKVLLNDEAGRQDIPSALGASWLGRLAGADDLVVVFIATNSFPTTDGNTFLCTYNTALDNVYSTCLSMRTLMDILKQNVHCSRIVVVLQACYSGAAELTSGAKSLFSNYNLDPEKLQLGKGYVLVSSSRPDQMSWGNVFTTSLVKALREQDGLIPLELAFERACEATERKTSTTPGYKRQTPVIKSDWKGHDLIVGTPPAERVSDIPGAVQSFLGAEAHYLKANKLVEAGRLDEAMQAYEAAVSADPKYADALADYGAVLAMKSEWQAAAQKYERAIQVRPDDSLFRSNYARICLKLGLKERCKKELEAAYKINPKDKNVLVALADRCLTAGETDRAVDLLAQAVTLYPRAAGVHNRLSMAFSRRGDIEKALSHAQEAVKLDPASDSARLNFGSILLLQGDILSAVKVYREAAGLWPMNPDAHFLLSQALESSGDLAGARHELTQFLKLCPTGDPRGTAAREHLTELKSDKERQSHH